MTTHTTDPTPARGPSRADRMSRRTIAVIVGILFIVQVVTAMVGTSLIQAFVDGDTDA